MRVVTLSENGPHSPCFINCELTYGPIGPMRSVAVRGCPWKWIGPPLGSINPGCENCALHIIAKCQEASKTRLHPEGAPTGILHVPGDPWALPRAPQGPPGSPRTHQGPWGPRALWWPPAVRSNMPFRCNMPVQCNMPLQCNMVLSEPFLGSAWRESRVGNPGC